MKSANKIQLTGAKETLYITLCAKSIDSQAKHSLLHDTKAFDILNSVDYDFSKFKESKKTLVVIRAKQIDEWVKEFIAIHENAVVVYIGCGLDSRITRINPSAAISWYDLDYPEVIEVRKRFYEDKKGYKMIASSATDAVWLTQIPNDRPTMIIAEGVLEYVKAEDVKMLLQRLTNHFREGQIAFDVVSPFAVKYGNKKGNFHLWGVDDTSEIEIWNPKLKKLNEISIPKSEYMKELPISQRITYAIMAAVPILKKVLRLLRYQFIDYCQICGMPFDEGHVELIAKEVDGSNMLI
jgi:O-methyltransferase involved in polyketide biosynthesis